MRLLRNISTDRFASWFTISVSIMAAICWSIFLAGCTSPSTSKHLYLLEVDLQDFPRIKGSSIGQGLSQLLPRAPPVGLSPKEIPADIGSVASGIGGTVQSAPHHVGSGVEDIATEIKLHLPDYYRVGLWGYCSGDDDQKAVCSHPSLSFRFDLSAVLRSASPLVDHILHEKGNDNFGGYAKLSHRIISMCIIGFVSTLLGIAFGIRRRLCGGHKKLLTALHFCSTILATAAAIGITALYGILSHAINEGLNSFGGRAQMGGSMLALVWMVVVLSLGALVVWLIQLFRRKF